MPACRPRESRLQRLLRLVGFRRRCDDLIPWALPPDLPPDIGVREPRRPRPSQSGGAVALELPLDLD